MQLTIGFGGWVLVISDLFTIQSSFDQDDERQVSGQFYIHALALTEHPRG
jgi:hypothetical protein